MNAYPQHKRNYKPEFDMRTPGERWHEEVQDENQVLAGLIFSLAFVMILAIIVIVGGSQPAFVAHAQEDGRYLVASGDKTNWESHERMDLQDLDDAKRAEAEMIAEEGRLAAETEKAAQAVYYEEPAYYDYDYGYTYSPAVTGTGDLRHSGVESDDKYIYTWYSQNILPGNGLDIPGRHVGEGGYVMDGDGNIVVASSDLAYGTEVETPYGNAKVYDSGCASGVLDVYTNW